MTIYKYYVYAYLRNKDSKTAKAGTPYYIGKGTGDRYRVKKPNHNVPVPSSNSNIVILEDNLSELGAFAIERRMIAWYGRKDIDTGILLNRTDGGDGTGGYFHSEETKRNMSKAKSGANHPLYGKERTDAVKDKLSEKHGEEWEVITPEGEHMVVHSLTRFCSENDLGQAHLCRGYWKGWKARKVGCEWPELATKERKEPASKYTGVAWHKASKKWRAAIKKNGKHIHLGVFENEEDARDAYIEAKKRGA